MTTKYNINWLAPGVGVKRWIVGLIAGVLLIVLATVAAVLRFGELVPRSLWLNLYMVSLGLIAGIGLAGYALSRLVITLMQPYSNQGSSPSGSIATYRQRQRGPRVVAIGGGTGLPSALRAMKTHTNDLTAVVTVADDGGSSGRLRRDMGVLPPGDLRNNIVALADDESLMAKLFQFRFTEGELKGHAFGNLFISALASITDGGLITALIETARVLNIQGRVLPSTLQDVNLRAQVRLPGKTRTLTILGEAAIGDAGGVIEHMELVPENPPGYPGSVEAILNADMVVLGPGSLYTSILPNLLVPDIANALRATPAYIVYICNVATQPGETDGYTVAEHVMALEELTGRGVFQAVVANNAYPTPPPESNTNYVMSVAQNHHVLQRYEIFYTDLTDNERPWRHDPAKLSQSLMALYEAERYNKPLDPALFAAPPKTS
jgi:uncharacterized cofD-like protein